MELLKIADFGLSKILPGETSSMTADLGTTAFRAPEVVRQEGPDERKFYDFSADVWSAGIVAHLLGTGKHPKEGNCNCTHCFCLSKGISVFLGS